MLRPVPVLVGLSLLILALTPVASTAADIHKAGGAWARYRVPGAGASLPRIDTLTLSTPRVETTPAGDALWFQMEAEWQGTRVFAIAMLVSDVQFLDGTGAPPVVHRYILVPGKGDPLEYVDRATGEAFLPRFGLFDGLLPTAPAGSPAPLFELDEFLGRSLALESSSLVGAQMLASFKGHPVLELDDRVLIGSSRHFRDDGTGREMDYQVIPPQPGDYRYVPLGKADYEEMIDAGFNLFRLPIGHLDWVLAEPVFFLLYGGTGAVPDLLYRSNYRGGVMYMDEPEIRASRQEGFENIEVPEVAAQAVAEYTVETLQGSTIYGSGYLATVLSQESWNLGPRVDVTELTTPSWESNAGTGWYQMEAGAKGLVEQSRIVPVEYSEGVQERFGVDFPAEAEPWIRFELGMATGAVERFGGDWGVSVFGQMDEAAADMLFPMAYERGARYFWVWTSSKDHHVPHERQLEIVRNFRDWLGSEPGLRPRQSRPLVAIAIPWGYNCDRSNLKGEDPGFLWWRTQIRLDDRNSTGVEYREVLAAIYRTYLERIDAGEEVDLVYVRDGDVFPGEGYDAVYRVLPTGEVGTGSTSSPAVTPFPALSLQVRPNPFGERTSLHFDVPHGVITRVHVYDAAGRLVRTVLRDSRLEEGGHSFWWNGRDDAGLRVSSGVYFARAVVGAQERTRKIVLLR